MQRISAGHVAMDKNYHRDIYNVKVLREVDIDSDHNDSKIKITLNTKRKSKISTKAQ